eukprot:TRINITY_DN660_c0_g1_i2.p1 TRINITY_DN660_c0_g1~~TRINITY_DN660_c0_g1_i2.p1  ORF type:complete len:222 (-),score=18.64 TRINITY_DN660_c0_g1_i2:103-768(-)
MGQYFFINSMQKRAKRGNSSLHSQRDVEETCMISLNERNKENIIGTYPSAVDKIRPKLPLVKEESNGFESTALMETGERMKEHRYYTRSTTKKRKNYRKLTRASRRNSPQHAQLTLRIDLKFGEDGREIQPKKRIKLNSRRILKEIAQNHGLDPAEFISGVGETFKELPLLKPVIQKRVLEGRYLLASENHIIPGESLHRYTRAQRSAAAQLLGNSQAKFF